MAHKEIAEQLGISHRTVEKHIGKGTRDCARYVRERQAVLVDQQEGRGDIVRVKSELNGGITHG